MVIAGVTVGHCSPRIQSFPEVWAADCSRTESCGILQSAHSNSGIKLKSETFQTSPNPDFVSSASNMTSSAAGLSGWFHQHGIISLLGNLIHYHCVVSVAGDCRCSDIPFSEDFPLLLWVKVDGKMQKSHVICWIQSHWKYGVPKSKGSLSSSNCNLGVAHIYPQSETMYPKPPPDTKYMPLDSTSQFIGSRHFFVLQKTSGESSFATRLQDTAITKKIKGRELAFDVHSFCSYGGNGL